MKKIYSLFVTTLFTVTAFAQTTLWSENFGTTSSLPTGWVSTSTSAGWNASTSSASTGYSGASGAANVVFSGTGSNGVTHTLTYSNVSTIGYNNINIIWGGRGTSTFAQNIIFQWSTDGSTWNDVAYTYSKNGNSWALVNGGVAIQLPAAVENSSTLSFRWSSTTSNSGNYRIDDIKVIGTSPSLATNEIKANKSLFVKNTIVKNDIAFGAKSNVKIYNIAGQVVKNGTVSENQSLNVSDLKEGTYIVTGTVNGQLVSEKIIKR